MPAYEHVSDKYAGSIKLFTDGAKPANGVAAVFYASEACFKPVELHRYASVFG